MSLHSGERQVSPTIDGIRRDHRARYEWAAKRIPSGSKVVDLACGIGYGTRILAETGNSVLGIDRDREAIEYARQYYAHKSAFFSINPLSVPSFEPAAAVVCFETIEHIEDPLPMLRDMHRCAPLLIASVPNETVFPWNNYEFHYRHYTKDEFEALLNSAGWQVTEWWGQEGPQSEVERDCMGRTIIAVCQRAQEVVKPVDPVISEPETGPGHVAILGLGPSLRQFPEIVKRMGGKSAFCDEVWGINALGDVFACDRVFHMDDVRIQQIRADAKPESNIANMLAWMKTHPGPIVTSRAHPDYPGLVEFPLQDVLNEFPLAYFNSTAAYAVAYALHLGVRKITLFGCDFTYPNSNDAEKGRACVEFWLGMAAERGIEISVPKTTSLLDALNSQAERFYGYDCVDLTFARSTDGVRVSFRERAELPTAEDIERNYDHSVHPNALIRETAAHSSAPETK